MTLLDKRTQRHALALFLLFPLRVGWRDALPQNGRQVAGALHVFSRTRGYPVTCVDHGDPRHTPRHGVPDLYTTPVR